MKAKPSWFFTQLQKSLGAKYRQRIPKGRTDTQFRMTEQGIIVQGKPKDNKCKASEAQQLRRDLYCFCDALYRYLKTYKPIFLETYLAELLKGQKKQSLRSAFMSLCLKGELYEILLAWCNAKVEIVKCEPITGGIKVIGKIIFLEEPPTEVEDTKRPIRPRP